MDTTEQPVWMTRRELSERAKIPTATLSKRASQGKGPKYARFGRHCRYRLTDVISWEEEQLVGGAS
jgi:predicted transcriptional regulator